MNYSVLYYPNFEPDQKWLRSVLLFVDEVQRIIPHRANHVDSIPTQRLLELMPDAIKTISLDENDKRLDDVNLVRMEKAFALIRERTGGKRRRHLILEFGSSGDVSVAGGVWLSRSKLTEQIERLLSKYGLAETKLFGANNPFDGGDTFLANETASNLIVSYVADRIAQRTGLDTITDVSIPHAVHSLDALNISPASLAREGEGLLAASIANLAVPEGIEQLNVFEYQELRKSFEEIRVPFHDLVGALSYKTKMFRQQSATGLESRIEQAIANYKEQVERYKKYAAIKKINRWTPIAFQGLLSLVMPFGSETAQFIEASGIFGLEVIKNIPAVRTPRVEHEETFKMLCQLGKVVKQNAVVKLLI
jgi:hypothetical protein